MNGMIQLSLQAQSRQKALRQAQNQKRNPVQNVSPLKIIAVFAPLALCACTTEPVGDFGRKTSSVFHDTILGAAGKVAARGREEPVSSYELTDDERGLRAQAWDLVRPPTGLFKGTVEFTLSWSRLAPQAWAYMGENDYYKALMSDTVASHETRYERIIAQARADAERLPAFRHIAVQVGKGDGARRAAMRALEADATMRNEAEARILENRRIVDWVEASLRRRILAYRTALGRIMVETPSTKAVDAEAAIDALNWEVNGRDGGAIGASSAPRRRLPKDGFRPLSPAEENHRK